MFSIFETQLGYDLARAALKRLNKTKTTDWEQRRYEVARDCLAAMSSNVVDFNADSMASLSITLADSLISKLKEGRHEQENQ